MILLDANVLLYAYNADAPQHSATLKWLTEVLRGSQTVGIPWLTSWAFLRISTNPRLFPVPLTATEAFAIVKELTAHPNITIPEPGPRHAELLHRVVAENRAEGALVTDALLVALALEHGAALASADTGFGRFKEIKWLNPLEKSSRRNS